MPRHQRRDVPKKVRRTPRRGENKKPSGQQIWRADTSEEVLEEAMGQTRKGPVHVDAGLSDALRDGSPGANGPASHVQRVNMGEQLRGSESVSSGRSGAWRGRRLETDWQTRRSGHHGRGELGKSMISDSTSSGRGRRLEMDAQNHGSGPQRIAEGREGTEYCVSGAGHRRYPCSPGTGHGSGGWPDARHCHALEVSRQSGYVLRQLRR